MEKAFSPFLWETTQWRAGLSTPGCCFDSLNTVTPPKWEIQFLCILRGSRAHFKSPEKMWFWCRFFSLNLYHAFPTHCHENWLLSHYSKFCANTTKINCKSVLPLLGKVWGAMKSLRVLILQEDSTVVYHLLWKSLVHELLILTTQKAILDKEVNVL